MSLQAGALDGWTCQTDTSRHVLPSKFSNSLPRTPPIQGVSSLSVDSQKHFSHVQTVLNKGIFPLSPDVMRDTSDT